MIQMVRVLDGIAGELLVGLITELQMALLDMCALFLSVDVFINP